jgi:dGTPase
VHDFEDAIITGYLDVRALSARADHEELVDSMVEWIGGELDHATLVAAFDRLDSLPVWVEDWDGSRRDQARLKNLTSQLIGRFAGTAVRATREAYPQAELARFGADVVVPLETQAEIAVLKGIVAANVMSTNARKPIYAQQRDILKELADALWNDPSHLDAGFASDFAAASDDTARKRVIVDQVASLTDPSANDWHDRLC